MNKAKVIAEGLDRIKKEKLKNSKKAKQNWYMSLRRSLNDIDNYGWGRRK